MIDEEYKQLLQEAMIPFHDALITQATLCQIKDEVNRVQQEYLAWHPNLVAAHEPHVGLTYNNHLYIEAPIITVKEKFELDSQTAEGERLLKALHKQLDDQIKLEARRQRRMLKMHKKLEAKHLDNIPPATRAIWDTLTEPQQYAILKDFDYNYRHKNESDA
jgi:hypothetical protein